MQRTPLKLLAALVLTSSVALAAQAPSQIPRLSPDMSAAEFADAVGGTLDNCTNGPSLTWVQLGPQVFYGQLAGTGTGWKEEFILVRPISTTKRPVLVFWHQYGKELTDLKNTTYLQEAIQRDWYLIAPLGAHRYHFGIDYAQENIRVLTCYLGDWVGRAPSVANFDEERIYGVGFSMGGGALTAYASRHLDPTEYPYAAIVNHTGTMSIAPLYKTGSIFDHPLMFGGGPKQFRYRYTIASPIFLYPCPNVVNVQAVRVGVHVHADLIRNVPQFQMRTFTATGDSHANIAQCLLFDAHTQIQLGYPGFTSRTGPGNNHRWSTLNETQTCDYLFSHTFSRPTGPTRILADREARYYDITVKPVNQNQLCPFEFDVTNVATANTLDLTTSQETKAFQIHTLEMGLDPTDTAVNTLTLKLHGPAGPPAPVTLKVEGNGNPPPGSATRTPPHAGSTAQWNGTGTIMTIYEPDPGSNPTWTIP